MRHARRAAAMFTRAVLPLRAERCLLLPRAMARQRHYFFRLFSLPDLLRRAAVAVARRRRYAPMPFSLAAAEPFRYAIFAIIFFHYCRHYYFFAIIFISFLLHIFD